VIRPLALLVAQTLAVVSILASLLVLAGRHPLHVDLTPDGSLTLSPHTDRVLARLHEPVTATAFTSGQDQGIRKQIADLLARYRDTQPALTVRVLDLDRSPGEAARLGVSNYNVVVLESGGRRQRIDPVNEDTLTEGLRAVSGRQPVIAYVVQGHGEPDAHDADGRGGGADAAAALAGDGFDVRALTGAGLIPDDAGLVVLAGPTHELTPAEVDALDAYAHRGGRLLVLVDQGTPKSIAALLERFGIVLDRDVVVDEGARLFGADALSARIAHWNPKLVPDAPASSALLPLAQSIRLEERPGVDAEYLAVTDETTWGDTGGRAPESPRSFRPGTDFGGPLPIAAIARVAGDGQREGRLVAIGDAGFTSNLHLGVLGNRDLLLVAAEVAARDKDAMTAARRQPRGGGPFSSLVLTAREARTVFWAACGAPALLFATGALLITLRRRRSA
jgi:hypothetical protein